MGGNTQRVESERNLREDEANRGTVEADTTWERNQTKDTPRKGNGPGEKTEERKTGG